MSPWGRKCADLFQVTRKYADIELPGDFRIMRKKAAALCRLTGGLLC